MVHVTDFDSAHSLASHLHDIARSAVAPTAAGRELYLSHFEYLRAPPAPYPKHYAAFLAKTQSLTWMQYACLKVHEGSASRRVKPPSGCAGSWSAHFTRMGKDLFAWRS